MAIVSQFESRLEAINKKLMEIADRETPLLKRHLDLSNPVDAIKWEWVDKTLKGLTDTLAATAVTAATIVTLNGGTNAPKRIIDNVTVFLAGSERMLVTSTITVVTNSSQHVVTRAYDSTTAVQHNPSKEFIILNSRAEGFTAGRDDTQKGTRQYNYTGIIEREAKVTGSAQAIDAVGAENTLEKQIEDLIPEVLKQLEVMLLYGARKANADLTAREPGGFVWWAQNVGTSTTATTLNDAVFDTVIKNYLKKGGDANQLAAIVSVTQQQKVNELKEARVVSGGMTQGETNINNFVTRYDFGSKAQIEIFYSTDVREDEAIFYQKNKVKVKPLKGRQVFRKKLPEDGDFKREMVCGEYTFEFSNARETLYHYTGLAV